jgi:acetolactate synthase-1/2/3 large subunit
MAPVATSLMGKGCFPENHPLSVGTLGMHGSSVANKIILEADVILTVGARFSDRTTGTLDGFCPEAKIIHIDIDSAEIGKNVDVEIPLVADAKRTLEAIYRQIIQGLAKKKESLWFDRVQDVKNQFKGEVNQNEGDLKPKRLLTELRKLLPENAIITTEVGQNQMWATLHFKAYKPRSFISSGGLGTMGFGFPAALGAKVACPDSLVVDIAGDGSFIMTSQDLACSVMENIPVIVIVLNNSMLGMVAQWQRFFYGRRYTSVELGRIPDFVKLAESYGAQGFRVGSIKEFSSAVKKAIKSDVTTVIDVPISPEENVFPMIPPGKGLEGMIEEWKE